ncbi:YlbL family protein [Subtercola boreus]|uniref:endopeptidase La n=1 Tax=Subtercola boreus TaxID=120213 RepID=A0A3E0W8Z7_9MICO|nr:S16 family serine protease [Subtercola boreus]RFA19966.1 ATP-dependent serine peptidase containing a PDZ domain protein [Subtercola boreus]RFA20095.1 ATP-dependent serine peptidase containing a PDZ domain protein [Subtercola boreus]RFA26421.1 ATP-dependent serine peptidase containing a PDZ domain protein [Subtercola boreus]
MSLFGETQPTEPAKPRSRRRTAGWVSLIAALVLALGMSFIPSPYVIEQPGPVFNTLGTSDHDGTAVPLITIQGATTYPTSGALDMLTVSVVGTPDSRPSWAEIVGAWFDTSRAIVPLEAIYPPSVSVDQQNEENAAQMVDSQQEAIAAALTDLKIPFTTTATVGVAQVADGSPATGILQSGDLIDSVNGTAVTTVDGLKAAVTANGDAAPATIVITRDSAESTVQVTPKAGDGGAVLLGIGAATTANYDFPFTVNIQLDNVGGPSAGMMFALGIIDQLTPGELNGGQKVAGTGTITADGTVGPIGGIRQKLSGAKQSGATVFLAPSTNCDEVVGHVPDGLKVFAVTTLSDSLTVLNDISSGTNTDSLPTCDTVQAAG